MVLHHQVELGFALVPFVQAHNVGVRHRAQDVHLGGEHAVLAVVGARGRLLDHLDRNRRTLLQLELREVVLARAQNHLGEVARTELLAELVVGVRIGEAGAEHGPRARGAMVHGRYRRRASDGRHCRA